jgi:hypothetical protein
MSMLNGFPMVNQNTNITSDGRVSENASEDCVAASICAACMYLNGIHQLDHDKYNPDKFKDMAYGEALRNSGTAAVKYVSYCASLGVKLYPVDGDYPILIGKAHRFLAEGKPVIFTQDDWIVDTSLPEYQGWTHVAAWYADGPGTLTSMDPWGGFPRMKSDAGWIAVMRFNEIWIAERITMSTLDTLKQHGWHDDGTTLVAPNSVPVVRGFRGYILAHNWNPDNWPLAAEHGTPQLEGSNPSLGGGTQQVFRWTMLGWTEAHGAFEEWTGQELLYLSKKVADYYKQVQDLQKQLQGGQPIPPTDPLASQALAVVRQIKPLFQPF